MRADLPSHAFQLVSVRLLLDVKAAFASVALEYVYG